MGVWYAYKNISGTSIKPYAGNCPPYYDLSGVPWFDKLTNSIPDIQQKTLELLSRKTVDVKAYYNAGLVQRGKWESVAFLVWNMKRKMPKEAKDIFEHMKVIPGLVSLSVSVLKPSTHIKPHSGDTDATYRLHIPVFIPGSLPDCGIKVAGISKPWPTNEVITFCDAYLHEAWNNTDNWRIILIADVIRPEHLSKTRIICANVAAWLFLQKIFQFKALNILPNWIKIVIAVAGFAAAIPGFWLAQRWR